MIDKIIDAISGTFESLWKQDIIIYLALGLIAVIAYFVWGWLF